VGTRLASEVTQIPIMAETLAVLEIWYLMLRFLRPFSSHAACPCVLSLLARKLETLAFAGVQCIFFVYVEFENLIDSVLALDLLPAKTWLFHPPI